MIAAMLVNHRSGGARGSLCGLCAGLAVLLFVPSARAEDVTRSSHVTATAPTPTALDAGAGATSPGDAVVTVESLEHELAVVVAEERQALAGADCATACRALASILRATDKLCALDAGARCESARATADDATRRVREACPQCAVALAPMKAAPAPAAASPRDVGRQDAVVTAEASPGKRGGCAGCSTTSGGGGEGALAGILFLAWAASRRRRRA